MGELNAIHPLAAPAAVTSAQERADEILRLWIVDRKELAVTFPADLYGEDIWKWGRVLANIARYLAHAEAQRRGVPFDEALEAVRLNFDQEIRSSGQIIGDLQATKES